MKIYKIIKNFNSKYYGRVKSGQYLLTKDLGVPDEDYSLRHTYGDFRGKVQFIGKIEKSHRYDTNSILTRKQVTDMIKFEKLKQNARLNNIKALMKRMNIEYSEDSLND